MVEGARTMANHIPPLAQLFRGMAELIDHDHTSQTHYEAITNAAAVVAARATTWQLVAGPLWEADGANLLAAAYAFHAGLPRQAATASHVRALVETNPAPPQGGSHARPGDPSPAPPFTSWTLPMRPSCGPPCPSFGVARSSRVASSSG
jgi:hypothetical protein